VIFSDESVKTNFESCTPLLKVVCSELEFEFQKHMAQIEMMECSPTGFAVLAVDNAAQSTITEVCTAINRRYRRKDQKPTVHLADPKDPLVNVICTDKDDLEYLH
jgi:hypothetical protein